MRSLTLFFVALVVIGGCFILYMQFQFAYLASESDVTIHASNAGTVAVAVECSSNCDSGGSAAASSGGGGGGGGAAPLSLSSFQVIDFILKAVVVRGERVTKYVELYNSGDVPLTVSISNNASWLFLPEVSIVIPPRSRVSFPVILISSSDMKPDIYTSTIIMKSEADVKKLPVVFEVRLIKRLFDVFLSIEASSKLISIPDGIHYELTISPLEEVSDLPVGLEFVIKDFDDNILFIISDSLVLNEKQTSKNVLSNLPQLKDGSYMLLVRATSGEYVSAASDIFSVQQPVSYSYLLYILLFIVFIVFLIVVYYELKTRRLRKAVYVQSKQLMDIRASIIGKSLTKVEVGVQLDELKKQRDIIELAFEKQYVDASTRDRVVRRIEMLERYLREN
ncbi:MAG TPA: hypothetical protein VJK51_05230 [Candidatus Nanoarchaeia archaeon]|nr:hypothetical protein [Candidatus Nanoarchaeia archaeon]